MNNDTLNSLHVLGNSYKNAKTDIDKLNAKQYYMFFLKKLVNSNDFDRKYYEELLKSDGFDSDSIKSMLDKLNIKTKEETYDFVLDNSINIENNKLIRQLEEDLSNPNSLKINTWISNYKSFVERNKTKFNLDRLFIFLNSKLGSKYSNKLNDFINSLKNTKEENIEHELNIVKVKRNFSTRLKNKINSIHVARLLKEKDINLDIESGNLLDKDNKSFSNKSLSRKMYDFIKSKLIKMNYSEYNGTINKDYIKNRYLSMLSGVKLLDKVRDKFDVYDNIQEEDTLFKKGLGKC